MLTSEDLAQITSIMRAETAALAQQIDVRIAAAEERMQEFTRTIETNLLTAFHSHAKGQTARLHTAESTAHDFGIRLAAIEERLLNLETRRH
jgi:hypothetical protein